jgi:hypothetical protein
VAKDGVGLCPVKLSDGGRSDIDFDAMSGISPFANVYDVYTNTISLGDALKLKQLVSFSGHASELSGIAPASKVRYLHRNSDGLIDIVVLEGYTYSGYRFGIIRRADGGEQTLYTLTYADKDGKTGEYSYSIDSDINVPYGSYVGMIPGEAGPAVVLTCTSAGTAARADFNFDKSVTVGGKTQDRDLYITLREKDNRWAIVSINSAGK